MKKLIETLRSLGIEVPEDKEKEVKTKLSEYYKNIAEVKKTTDSLETDRDEWKKRAETAEETLKKFDGVDLETMQAEIATWKQKAETAREEYEQKIAEHEFEDILKSAISEAKGRNEKAIRANLDIESLMKSKNQRDDIKKALDDLKGAEDTAFMFVDEKQEQLEAGRAKPFTGPLNPNGGAPAGKKVSPSELMKMKNENPNLDIRQYM